MVPPTGTITFLFTDIEGSTHLWDEHPDAMRTALTAHDTLMRALIAEEGGYLFKTGGDSLCAAFATAPEGLHAALRAQKALHSETWPANAPLRVRMSLNTGVADERDGDYFGPALNRTARLLVVGHGGQVVLSRATYDLVRDDLPPGVLLKDHGEQDLRDLGRKEHVFELRHPALPGEFPPLRSENRHPHNLPLQITSFVGREREMLEVKRLLAEARLLTLVGAGGTGKTRLCLQAAAEVMENYSDGVWLVELAALVEPNLIPQAIASVLNVREKHGESLAQTLAEFLRERKLLLILDNCEHLLVACARLTETLLRACPHLTVLASSREGLGVAGEQTFPVPSLTLPNPQKLQTAQSLTQYEAVRLFIDRAQLNQPSFAVTNANAPAVAQLCHRLDGIPLALELAAARVKALSVEQIATRLDDRFRLLTGGARTALPRQRTLRAMIDWSYDLLTEAEKALFCRLSVFAGGWTLEAAERVSTDAESADVLDLLMSLVDKNLVTHEEDPRGRSRYRLSETVRQYAQDALRERGAEAEARRLHRDYFLAFTEDISPTLRGPEQADGFAVFEAEHDNLRAALAAPRNTPEEIDAGLRMVAAMTRFWYVRGYLQEGQQHLAEAVRQAQDAPPSAARARARNGAGLLSRHRNDPQTAETYYLAALSDWDALGSDSGSYPTLSNLGTFYRDRCDFARADNYYTRAAQVAQAGDDRSQIAGAVHNQASVALTRGEYARALPLLEETLTICREVGNRTLETETLQELGDLAFSQGDTAAAGTRYAEALTAAHALGYSLMVPSLLAGLGYVALYDADFDTALLRWQEAKAARLAIGWTELDAPEWVGLGRMALRQKDYLSARSHFAQALRLARRRDWIRQQVGLLEQIGLMAASEGRSHSAVQLLGAAARARQESSLPPVPRARVEQEETLVSLRAAHSHEEFESAWDAGQALTLTQAIEFALAPP